MRIDKFFSELKICSRKECGEKLKRGLITVNGEKIRADGVTLRYIKLYKPRGYVTTMSDEQGRKTVTDLLDGIEERVYPIGRLDRTSEGLLLLTNDGAFANDIMHPTKHVAKTYRVTVAEKVTEEQVNKLMSGVEIEPNVMTRPCIINILVEEEERTVLEFIIKEGKNRQIRRMCEAVNLTVKRLRRTSIAGVKLGMLKPGEYADLTKEEMRILRSAIGQQERPANGRKGGKRR